MNRSNIVFVFAFVLLISSVSAELGFDDPKLPKLEGEFLPAGGGTMGNVSGTGAANRFTVWDSATTITYRNALRVCQNGAGDYYFCTVSSTDSGNIIFSVHGDNGAGSGLEITDAGNMTSYAQNIYFAGDNLNDIGKVDGLRPRSIYSGTSMETIHFRGNGSYISDVCLTNGTGCPAQANLTNYALKNQTNNFTAGQIFSNNVNITGKVWIGDTSHNDGFTAVTQANIINPTSAYALHLRGNSDTYATLETASHIYYFYQRNGGGAGQTTSGFLSWDRYGSANSMLAGQNDGDVCIGGTITDGTQATTCTGARVKVFSGGSIFTDPINGASTINGTVINATRGIDAMNGTINTNFTVKQQSNALSLNASDFYRLGLSTLPACDAASNGTIRRNNTGLYDCPDGFNWVKL